MNVPARRPAFQSLVADWQKRHGLPDHDPLLAVNELFELLLVSLETREKGPSEKLLVELLDAIELQSHCARALSKQIDETLAASRESLPRDQGGWGVVLCGAVLFAAGVTLGRWML